MIGFEINEILYAAISALIYGAFFSLFISLIKVFFYALKKSLFSVYIGIFYKGRIFDVSAQKNIKYREENRSDAFSGEIFRAVSVILYSLGLVTVSYYVLDGQLRLYIFVLSLCGAYIFLKYPLHFAEKITVWILDRLLLTVTLILRTFFYPIRSIFGFLYSKFVKIGCISRIKHVFCSNLSLDFTDKK